MEVSNLLASKTVIKVQRTLLGTAQIADQISAPSQIDAQWVWNNSKIMLAQTFTPTVPDLSGAIFYLGYKGVAGKLQIDIAQVDSNGAPTSSVVASQTLDYKYYPTEGYYTVPFNATLSVGRQYSFVFSQHSGQIGSIWFLGRSSGISTYSGGSMWTSNDFGKSWNQTSLDTAFETFHLGSLSSTDLLKASTSNVSLSKWNMTSNSGQQIDSLSFIKKENIVSDISMNSPDKYSIRSNSTMPFYLVLAESFDPYWSISLKGAPHFIAYGVVNAFFVDSIGARDIFLNFSSAAPISLGVTISVFSFGVMLLIALPDTLWERLKSRL
jgi:hypothetical protein